EAASEVGTEDLEEELALKGTVDLSDLTAVEKAAKSERDRAAGYRALLNRISFTLKQRAKEAEHLQLEINMAESKNEANSKAIRASEELVAQLDERLTKVYEHIALAEHVGKYYDLVLETCKRNEGSDAQHMSKLESAVDAVKMELQHVTKMKEQAAFDLKHLLHHEKPKLEAEVEKSKVMRSKIMKKLQVKKQEVAERVEKRQNALIKARSGGSAQKIASKRRNSMEERLAEQSLEQRKKESALRAESDALRKKLEEQSEAFARVRSVTGARDMKELQAMFVDRETVLKGLNEQKSSQEQLLQQLL
ncbi:unnamed protein product, partial [Symbiodinium sp. KB8]